MLDSIVQKIIEQPDTPFIDRLFSKEEAQSIFDWKDVSFLLRNNDYKFEIINNFGDKIVVPKFHHDWAIYDGAVQDKAFIYKHIKAGNGFVILGQSNYNEMMYDLSKTFEEKLKQSLDIHVYGGYNKNSKSFAAHTDPTMNLILQIDGVSLWRVYAQKRHEVEPKDTHLLTEIFSKKLYPGMLLYIPRYLYHKCEGMQKRLSFSFAMSNINVSNEPRMSFEL